MRPHPLRPVTTGRGPVTTGRGPVTTGRGPVTTERGSVTAELAVGFVAVVVGLLLVLSVAVVARAEVAAVLGAGAGARAAARGEGARQVVAAARGVAGGDSTVTTTADGSLVHVSVVRRLQLPLPGTGALAVRASAAALQETAGGNG